MTELIVGFPQQDSPEPRPPSPKLNALVSKCLDDILLPSSISSTSRGRRRRHAVRFSPMSELVFFERAEESDHDIIWYNSKDYADMRKANKRDVLEVHRRFVDDDGALDDVNTTGIEGLLTPGMIKRCHVDRIKCVNAVLDEQDRQDEDRECDPVKLAEVAGRHSRGAVRRAQKIGVLQSR